MKSLPIGSKRISASGYIQIKIRKGQRRWPWEHRVIWEKAHGRIPAGHFIHHRNGIKTDNRLKNLTLTSSHRDHFLQHHRDIMARNGKKVGKLNKGVPKPLSQRRKMSLARHKFLHSRNHDAPCRCRYKHYGAAAPVLWKKGIPSVVIDSRQ